MSQSTAEVTATSTPEFSNDAMPLDEFNSLFQQRTDGDQSITDEILSEAFAKSIPGLPEGSIQIRIADKPKFSPYSVSNPSPEFIRLRDDPASKIVVNDPGLIILDETTYKESDDGKTVDENPSFFAIGPEYTDMQSSDDYAYGSSSKEAGNLYLDQLKERTRKAAINAFIMADKMMDQAKTIHRNYDHAVENLARIMGIGSHFQDEEGTVYQLDVQEWIRVKVKPMVVNRTRREGERNGELSLTAARELGYEVEGKFPDTLLEKYPNVDKLLKTGITLEEQNNVALEYARLMITNNERSPAESSLLQKLTTAIEKFEETAYPEVGKTTTDKSPASMDLGDTKCGYDPNDPDQQGVPASDKAVPVDEPIQTGTIEGTE